MLSEEEKKAKQHEYSKRYRQRHPDRIEEQRHRYYETHREHVNAYNRKWRAEHREQVRFSVKKSQIMAAKRKEKQYDPDTGRAVDTGRGD